MEHPQHSDNYDDMEAYNHLAYQGSGLPLPTSLNGVLSTPPIHRVEDLTNAEVASRDGADSGIDVKHESPFPKALPTAHDKQSKGNDCIPPTPSPVHHRKSKTPSDPNYKRWKSGPNLRQLDPGTQQRLMRMATVSARRRPSSLYSDDSVRMPGKIITWHEAMESRPPLRIDMCGPSPTTYSPRNKPLYETNAPAFSFGRKEEEKEGSGQRAWSKLWIRSHSPFHHKTSYELRWPTPSHYQHKSVLGPKQSNFHGYPSHSIGVRRNTCPVTKEKEFVPGSNEYEPQLAIRQIMRTAPAFSMGCKLPNSSWEKSRATAPAPNIYNPRSSLRLVKPTRPAFTMCVERRTKRHDVGPFATL